MEKPGVIIIGGSAGSLSPLTTILKAFPDHYCFSIIIVLHRMKNVVSEMDRILSMSRKGMKISEPDDKSPIREGCVYLAPQNYHLLIEEDRTFSLDYSELINYSRPSIDLTFECVANVYGKNAVAILLSGANNDGTAGMKHIIDKGGTALVQHPDSAEYATMPRAAMEKNAAAKVLRPEEIVDFLKTIPH
ncbi:chemotaxis protein CheB [Tellurirhabdus bombi]|uniref:chemotaxis protein CheB n=1 Tax=Tellurirhabdus bombi TaxID=2907205 RepID=UPI001F213B7D|nr:chemotaxis protein CheB [Tellurirhabdus bombi]